LFSRLGAIHFRLVDDLNLQIAELDVDLVHFLRGHGRVSQDITDVAVGEVTLFLRLADQLLDLLGDVHTGSILDGANVGRGTIAIAGGQLSQLAGRGSDGHGWFLRNDDIHLALAVVGGPLGAAIALVGLGSR